MSEIKLREVSINDLSQLREISIQTFQDAFGSQNTKENMLQYLAENFSEEKLKNEIVSSECKFYFAEMENRIVGYIKVNFNSAQTEIIDLNWVEIERIYVLKEFQGMKIGQVLSAKAIDIARQKGAKYLWLGVWEKNPKAIKFYKRIGFDEFAKHDFILGTELQTDIMMRMKIE